MTRDDVLKEFYATPAVPGGSSDRMADEIVRLRSILAALREPSEEVVQAVKDAIYEELGIEYWDGKTRRLLYYAVIAAEQEVDHFGDVNKMVRPEVANDAG